MTDDENIIHTAGKNQHIFGERLEDYRSPNVIKVADGVLAISKRYIGANVGEIHLQDGSEVTIVLGKGSKIHIVNEGE